MDSRRCNLCLKRAPMTEDHLFPKGLVTPGQRRVTKILHKIDPSCRWNRGTFLAQNGVKKSTLCSDCNNRVLGAYLDPSLIELYKSTSTALERGRFPVIEPIKLTGVNLKKVARAVAGHLVALDDQPQVRNKTTRHLRRFVLQENADLHSTLRFKMWLYPFSRQGMFNNLYHAEFGTSYDPLWISAFKTYPLAFAFCTEVQNPNYRLRGVMDLTQFLTTDLNESYVIKITTKPIVDINWPFAPYRNGAILTGDNASVTTELYLNKKPLQKTPIVMSSSMAKQIEHPQAYRPE
ncbi:hypothetical protein CFBP2118_01141 [Pseudomonas syringae pv. syringae]|nr:hypothetical protein CFBP2118_01141 [Pseudomonas syringae pv. syringae]